MNEVSWILTLAKTVLPITDSRQRSSKVLRQLLLKPPSEIALFLREISHISEQRENPLSVLHLDLMRNRDLLQQWDYELICDVYSSAQEQGWSDVQVYLRPDRFHEDQKEAKPEGFAKRLAKLTLGERKQLSRNPSRASLEVLLFDSDPPIIRELLLNPKLTKRDVVRIAARHQAPPQVLEEVCRSSKWTVHYSVRKALIFNPGTPLAFALGFMNHLRLDDLRLLLTGGINRPEIVALAKERLARLQKK